MPTAAKPWWQQATALVSLGAGGAITGLHFAPGPVTEPGPLPPSSIRLLALDHAARRTPGSDQLMRSAIVNVARYYLRLAAGKTPAEMEALIWQHDSLDGVDHGESCAAFASLTLELGAQAAGRQSWVTGGTSYPWPLHKWADVRVDPNPGSLGITSVLQDAQAHHRWHPLGDGYRPQPGDWVLFSGHVEVVTRDAGGVLYTIGGDSLPNFSVNAHEYPAPLGAQGVVGFVDNGEIPAGRPAARTLAATARTRAARPGPAGGASGGLRIPGQPAPARAAGHGRPSPPAAGGAAQPAAAVLTADDAGSTPIPGFSAPAEIRAASRPPGRPAPKPGRPAAGPRPAGSAASPAIPGIVAPGSAAAPGRGTGQYRRYQPQAAAQPTAAGPGSSFISEVLPGALATQRQYGIPASVTIAQAIDESGWGQSELALNDHNLFGIKGTGPAGSTSLPTVEYENGQPVSTVAGFRVYDNVTQSIEDHGQLLATSGYYGRAMASRRNPDGFANALTGVYATDPQYGTKLIALMQRYDLYRFDAAPAGQAGPAGAAAPGRAASGSGAGHGGTAIPGLPGRLPRPAAPRRPPAPAGPAAPSSRPRPAPGSPAASQPLPASPGSGRPAPATSPAAGPVPLRSRPGSPVRTPASGRLPAGGGRGSRVPGPASPAARPPAAAPSGEVVVPGAPARSQPAGATPAPVPPAGSPVPSGGSPVPAPRPAPASPQPAPATAAVQSVTSRRLEIPASWQTRRPAAARAPRTARYQSRIPQPVRTAFLTAARPVLIRSEPLYRDVASHTGIRWELLAACDWMQCEANSRCSPVHGERLGSANQDGSCYRTRSSALEQCADDLVKLAWEIYRIDPTAPGPMSVRELASVFAAFRWGGLLRAHRTSALEFPYSVAGLTVGHMNMRWPDIAEPHAPDRPGTRFRRPFGAVPVVLGLDYPAVV